MDQASALLGQVGAIFADREKQLQKAEGDLRQKTVALQKEKEIMAKVPVADNDLLTLNIGGSIQVTKRSTLTQAEGSALAARFSGNWEQCLDHDDQGRVFLDFDPDLFKHVLFYLRSRAMLSSLDDEVPFPQVGEDKQHAFRNLIKYLALEEFMGCVPCTALCVIAAHPDIRLQAGVAETTSKSHYYRSINMGHLTREVCYMKCKIHVFKQWMFFGIAAGFDVAADGTQHVPYAHPSSFGWAAPHQQYRFGKDVGSGIPMKAGDCILLKADLALNKLSMRCTEGRPSAVGQHTEMTFTLTPEQRKKAFFHVILFWSGDKVELLPVTPEDQLLFP